MTGEGVTHAPHEIHSALFLLISTFKIRSCGICVRDASSLSMPDTSRKIERITPPWQTQIVGTSTEESHAPMRQERIS
ncbi:hypothetical protein D3C86_1709580 [compost metagenome]